VKQIAYGVEPGQIYTIPTTDGSMRSHHALTLCQDVDDDWKCLSLEIGKVETLYAWFLSEDRRVM